MNQPFRTAAVLGAGVMGSAIAAHLANAGLRTLLLDIVPPSLTEAERGQKAARDRLAVMGLERAIKARPAAFFHPQMAQLITVGNLEDDFSKLAEVDLVIEAVPEVVEIKRSLFERLEKVVRPDAVVASNTSGLPIRDLLDGRSKAFRQHFLVTHFFNPVRYMKLLELVTGPETLPEVLERVRHWGQDLLGKGIVMGRDTPNFVANRIGAFAMMVAIHQMLAQGLSPEEVDAIAGKPLARPKSAAFRTADMVGLDTLVHVADNCYRLLGDDPDRGAFEVPSFVRKMVERKLLGAKTQGGFYKKTPTGSATLDPRTGEYRETLQQSEILAFCKTLREIEDPAERVRKLMADPGPAGTYAWKVTAPVLMYSARLVGHICDDQRAIDEAMRWGYNWEMGPFELWDALGFRQTVERLERDGYVLPPAILKMRDQKIERFYDKRTHYDVVHGVLRERHEDKRFMPFSDMRGERPVERNASAALWDTGEGVFAMSMLSKANSIDPDVIEMLEKSVTRAENEGRALLLFNEGEHFCVGANLGAVVMAAMQKDFESLRTMIVRLQRAMLRMKYAKVPVVAAPFGMAVGGGLELCLGANHVQASAETYAGLVEVGVGLIPAGGGCTNLMFRALEAIPEGVTPDLYNLTTQVFRNIATAKVATSAVEAQSLGFFRWSDGVTFDQARLLHDARAFALSLSERGYHPPLARAHRLFGESGIATLRMMVRTMVQAGQATEHDGVIANHLAVILCGGVDGAAIPVTEEHMMELEAEAFLSLCGEQKTIERMQHMLMKHKPLRN